jgi:hypothetical protein
MMLTVFFAQPLQAQILQGGIEERVEPLKAGFRVGSEFNEDNLPGNHKLKQWYKLPDWLTGSFETKTLKHFGIFGETISKNETTFRRGLQKDKADTVWDAVIIPNYARVKSEGATDIDIFEEYEVLEAPAGKFRCKIKYTAITVDDTTKKILRAEKRTELQELTPLAPDAVLESSQQMRYDQDGKAITRKPKKLEVKIYRTGPFTAQDRSAGGTFNYKEEFRAYLTETNQTDLLPDLPVPDLPVSDLPGPDLPVSELSTPQSNKTTTAP